MLTHAALISRDLRGYPCGIKLTDIPQKPILMEQLKHILH